MNPSLTRVIRNSRVRLPQQYKSTHIVALVMGWSAAAQAESGVAADAGGWLAAPVGVALLIAACAWAFLHVLKRRQAASGQGQDSLQVVGTTALGAGQRAVVLRAGERMFLLGVSAQQVSLLAELAPAPRPAAADASATSQTLFKR
jgi:flagellar biosynthetic protein FliO